MTRTLGCIAAVLALTVFAAHAVEVDPAKVRHDLFPAKDDGKDTDKKNETSTSCPPGAIDGPEKLGISVKRLPATECYECGSRKECDKEGHCRTVTCLCGCGPTQ
jgi:hypothetical protein